MFSNSVVRAASWQWISIPSRRSQKGKSGTAEVTRPVRSPRRAAVKDAKAAAPPSLPLPATWSMVTWPTATKSRGPAMRSPRRITGMVFSAGLLAELRIGCRVHDLDLPDRAGKTPTLDVALRRDPGRAHLYPFREILPGARLRLDSRGFRRPGALE